MSPLREHISLRLQSLDSLTLFNQKEVKREENFQEHIREVFLRDLRIITDESPELKAGQAPEFSHCNTERRVGEGVGRSKFFYMLHESVGTI